MSFSLYDAVIPSMLQILGALDQLLVKAEPFCDERGVAQGALINARLAPDMLPFGYQVKSCAVHSTGAIEGVRAGSFSPDQSAWPTDFAGLRALLQRTQAQLSALDREEVNSLAGADVHFVVGTVRRPYTGEAFLLSFSQPNFYFHATTAYGILRAQGMELGKRDFLGQTRIAR